MNAARIGNTKHATPGEWDELQPQQLAFIATHYMQGMQKEAARLVFTQRLLGVRWYRPRLWWWWWVQLAADERYELLKLSDWIFEQNPSQNEWNLKAYKGLLAPADAWADTCAKEWGVADGWFNQWQRNRKAEALNAFVATLYRPKQNGARQPYHGAHYEHMDKVAKWPHGIRLGIAMNYRHQRRVLEKENPHVFGERKGSGNGNWFDVLLQMAGDKFGPLPDTERTPIRPFLRELDHRIEAQQKAEETRKK